MTMPRVQIAIDCADCHCLNRFWAAAVGYRIEDHNDLVTQMLAAGYATTDDTIEVDGRLAWKTAAACQDPQGHGPRLLFQEVPEAKVVKNRVHLDLDVGEDRRAGEVERLVGLGATRLYDGRLGPQSWVTMADPEGNEFCVA